MNIIYTDTLVVGGGLAGLRAAIASQVRGHNTIVLSLVPVRRSHSAAAQGGMQASLANNIMGEGDNEDVHFTDTVKGSDWGCDQQVARMFTYVAPKAVRELNLWGVPWSRVEKGKFEVTIGGEKKLISEKDIHYGLINARNFGGTAKWRTCYTADATGHTMLFAVANEAMRVDIDIRDRKEALKLIHDGKRCYGAIVRDLVTGVLEAYVSKATVIATGGYGRVYQATTNAVICEGIGQAIALETGVANLGNMEAVQFHPTGIVPSEILVSEGCRGDGGILRDVDGYRFMPDYEPEKKELASRDVVSRRMTEHIMKGKGVKSSYGDHLWLDISVLGRKHIEKNLRDVQDICETFLGVDPAEDKSWIPVRPVQHYSMGGIRTKYTGESNLKGLFSCGEAACWDLHGFNRLGGNSVSETVVSGMIIGEYVADFCDNNYLDIKTSTIESFQKMQAEEISTILKNTYTEKDNVYVIRNKMKELMFKKVGIFRDGKHLTEAVETLKELYQLSKKVGICSKSISANPELTDIIRVKKMLKISLCIALGAKERTESRGAHARDDYQKRDDKNWLKRTLTYWKDSSDDLPTIKYEDIDIMSMEIPPGFRGYGKRGNTIENPNTKLREDEIKGIKSKLKSKNRFDIQKAIMPYELPEKYKGKNERVGIDYE